MAEMLGLMTKRLTPEQLAQIRERAEKATEGPWRIGKQSPNGLQNIGTMDGMLTAQTIDFHDANFIAHARDDIPKLLAHIEKQTEEIRYYKGYADRYSEVIAEQKAEIEHLNERLAQAKEILDLDTVILDRVFGKDW